nr:hypothetical protein [Tanacetum cinerariifolium]
MDNILKDVQSDGSDTRPLMLDRSDFASWKKYIRLYFMGKDNGENIIKLIDEGPFKMENFRETLAVREEGALHLGPERDRVFIDLSPEEKERFKADIRSELTKDDHKSQLYGEFKHFHQNKGETIHDYYVRFAKVINDMRNIKMTMPKMQLNSKFVNKMLPEWGIMTAVKLNRGLKESNYDQLYAYLKQHEAHANENKMMLERYNQHAIDPLALVFNVSPLHNHPGAAAAGNRGVQNRVGNANPGQARQIKCYNCNEIGHIARNCTQLKRLQNLEYFKDKMLMQAQENEAILDEEQLLFIACGQTNTFDNDAPTAQTVFMVNPSSADPIYNEASPSYDSDILFEVQDQDIYQVAVCEHHEVHKMHNDVQPNYVVDSDAKYTSDSNMIPYDQYHKVVNASLTAELARYKEQVKMYERRENFELSEREQKIDEQLRIINTNHNIKEKKLKRELHFAIMQLNSTINHNKSMVEEVTTLKKNFQQKENKYLEEFLDMKALKEKVEDKLFKQDQSLQIVHMLCKPKPNYDEMKKVAIGYKNPLYLTRAKQVQPALYNGHEIIKIHHVPTIVHDLEDTLAIDETTRKKLNEKMKDPMCVKKKVKIIPHEYSKENYLANFTPQKQLTLEQIFGPMTF